MRSREALAVLRVGEIGERKWPDLLVAVAQHLAQRTVGMERSPVGVQQHDANRCAVKDGAKLCFASLQGNLGVPLRGDVAPGAPDANHPILFDDSHQTVDRPGLLPVGSDSRRH